MIMELPSEDRLAKAMAGKAPEIGPELEKLLVDWLSISSLKQPGQHNPLRFPFLKWAIAGRAAQTVDYLRRSKTDGAQEVLAEILRIADLPFPPRNEKAQDAAMEIWAWLKLELNGRL